jgi:hypothetical protein
MPHGCKFEALVYFVYKQWIKTSSDASSAENDSYNGTNLLRQFPISEFVNTNLTASNFLATFQAVMDCSADALTLRLIQKLRTMAESMG